MVQRAEQKTIYANYLGALDDIDSFLSEEGSALMVEIPRWTPPQSDDDAEKSSTDSDSKVAEDRGKLIAEARRQLTPAQITTLRKYNGLFSALVAKFDRQHQELALVCSPAVFREANRLRDDLLEITVEVNFGDWRFVDGDIRISVLNAMRADLGQPAVAS